MFCIQNIFEGVIKNVLIYLLPDRLLYTMNTAKQTKTTRRTMITPKTEANTGTKVEMELELSVALGVLLLPKPKLNNIVVWIT